MSRAARFVWVGVGGFALQALVLWLLAAAGLPYPLATALAVEAAILHNFLWHERWTWGDRTAGLKARNYDRTASSHDRTASSHDRTASSHDRTASSHDRTACSHDRTVRRRKRLARFLRFNGSTAVVSIGGNVALMWLLVGRLHLPLLLATLLAVLTLSVVNFAAADRVVFVTNVHPRRRDPTRMSSRRAIRRRRFGL